MSRPMLLATGGQLICPVGTVAGRDVRAVDLIHKTRDGIPLTGEEIAYLVRGATDGSIPDFQLAAWLMAIYCRGLTDEETVQLTLAMAHSGKTLEPSAIGAGALVADKHSTGGVGDKATLVVVPLVAACGVPVAKLSGRGLGHSGGTIDKLESFAGLRTTFSSEEFLRLVHVHGLAIAGQSAELAPADGTLYALRDAVGAVESAPLIASSVMSKKLAGGAQAILLDVKVGGGAFMRDLTAAWELARLMVAIGERAGRRVEAVLSAMDQPLGRAVGNALEVAEAIATLRDEGPGDLDELCRHEARQLLLLAGRTRSDEEAAELVERALHDGSALGKLAELVEAQGGDRAAVFDPQRLPSAPVVVTVRARADGYVARLDAKTVGVAAMRLGAGREVKGGAIRHDVGFVLHVKVGDAVRRGEPLVDVHAGSSDDATVASQAVLRAFGWSDEPIAPAPVLLSSDLTR